MKVIKATIPMLESRTLVIGFQAENQRTQVRIDCASVFEEYPHATSSLIVKPSFSAAYPVVVDRDGTDVVWLITSEILSFTGDGEIQLVFYKDEVICKSAIAKIRVCRSLQVTGDMPDPVAQWVDDANAKLAEVDAQIVELEGMVDTATDAATRAEQSASTASTKAEQAAGSAATATEKATEATNAAGTATAKAAEAQTAAQTATTKATAAAESERIATAKAGEATTAAETATAKAEQATEAAETATEKAGDASASATAAQTAATNASQSAQAASASQTAAEAAKTAAETSATQAATSAQTAGTAAQTATQKAAEATQSATNAATFAGTATTKAEEAAESAQAASDAQTAVEQTAEQLADSLEQIDQNTQDIAELDERKANIDGYYPDMTVGNAEQLNSSKYVENSEPYTLRTSGGSADIGNREYVDAVVGGTLAWNQAVRDSASENSTDFADVVTVTDAVEDAAEVKAKIEPVQDLHGYDHPWPAGGGKNKFNTDFSDTTVNGTAITKLSDGKVSTSGVPTSAFDLVIGTVTLPAGDYILNGCPAGGGATKYRLQVTDFPARENLGQDSGSGVSFTLSEEMVVAVRIQVYTGASASLTYAPMIRLASETDDTFAPYSNICPISGWDGVKVSRTGKNLWHGTLENGVDVLIPLKPGVTYTFTAGMVDATASSYLLVRRKAIGGESWVTVSYIISGTIVLPKTITAEAGYEYSMWSNSSYTNIKDIQIELGSTATAYEPYAGQTYSITLPTEAGTVYGGELTVNADGSGSLVVDRASVDLGTLNWAYDSTNAFFKYNLTVAKSGEPLLCSLYGYGGYKGDMQMATADIGIYNINTNAYIKVKDTAYSDAATFKAAMSGVQLAYELVTPITYTLTASQIRTLLGTNNVWADTGDVALTYTGTDEHLTLESGKKYLARISGTDSMLLGSGQEITAAKGTDNVFDLTRMFGTAVADYVYGQGASFFRKWFPNAVYPYNAGELRHVEGLQSHDMVGFNAWDEEWELGAYDNATGQKVVSSTRIRSKNYIPVTPENSYYFTFNSSAAVIIGYDSDGNYARVVKSFTSHGSFTTQNNIHYITFYLIDTTYKHNICINLVHNGSRNGEYEPYEKHSYSLDSSVILRGIPKVDANGVYWDGDRYLPDGTVERRYREIKSSNYACFGAFRNIMGVWVCSFRIDGTVAKSAKGIAICDALPSFPDLTYVSLDSNGIVKPLDGNFVGILGLTDETSGLSASSTASTVQATFANYLNARECSFVYELAEPTTETAQPYHSTQWVSDWGTEEFVSTGIVPVGHETRYPANLRDKLQHLPDAASGNGSYLITQTDGQMVLTPFPAPPSSAGNYVLKATVTGGVATYTWEVAT